MDTISPTAGSDVMREDRMVKRKNRGGGRITAIIAAIKALPCADSGNTWLDYTSETYLAATKKRLRVPRRVQLPERRAYIDESICFVSCL